LEKLEELQNELATKHGDKKLEEILGVRLEPHHIQLEYFEDPLPGESPSKGHKTYEDKRNER